MNLGKSFIFPPSVWIFFVIYQYSWFLLSPNSLYCYFFFYSGIITLWQISEIFLCNWKDCSTSEGEQDRNYRCKTPLVYKSWFWWFTFTWSAGMSLWVASLTRKGSKLREFARMPSFIGKEHRTMTPTSTTPAGVWKVLICFQPDNKGWFASLPIDVMICCSF